MVQCTVDTTIFVITCVILDDKSLYFSHFKAVFHVSLFYSDFLRPEFSDKPDVVLQSNISVSYT